VLLDRAAAAGGRDGSAGATADEGEEAEGEIVSISGSGWPAVEADDIVELRSRRTLSAALGAAVRVEPMALVSRVATKGSLPGAVFSQGFRGDGMALLYIWERSLRT